MSSKLHGCRIAESCHLLQIVSGRLGPVDNIDDWQRVARAVRDRRLALGLTQRKAVERSGDGVSLPVWSLIEAAKQSAYRERTLIAVARGLAWPPDAIDRILAGEDPTTLANTSARPGVATVTSIGHNATASNDEPDPTPPGGAAAEPIEQLAAKVTEMAATLELQQAQIAKLLEALNDPTRRRSRPSPPAGE
jgi:transcriptional regulator with XRE-family HTH domain